MDNTQPPLYIQPEISRRLQMFLLASHLGVALVVLFTPGMPWWGMAMLLPAIAFSLWYFWRLYISREHPASVFETTFYSIDIWRVHTRQGSGFARLDDSSFLHPWLCVLNLRGQGGKLHTLILLPDNVPADVLRRLRVRIRFA